MWEKMSLGTKLNILAGESTVEVGLLRECEPLMNKLRKGCTQDEALAVINENF